MLRFFRKDPRRPLILQLYARVVAAARQPALYENLGVPDTVEGRFEALVLHVVLVVRHLGRLPAPADDVAKDLTDAFFTQLDASLREMGVGDMAVPKRMKSLAEAYLGRAGAYNEALDRHDEEALAQALARNVYGRAEPARPLARYALMAERSLASIDLDALLAEGPRLPPPDSFGQEA